jgi:hypothetical protein
MKRSQLFQLFAVSRWVVDAKVFKGAKIVSAGMLFVHADLSSAPQLHGLHGTWTPVALAFR